MTEAQKKKRMYLVIGMSVLGLGLLAVLISFRGGPAETSGESAEINKNVDFNIKLDTVDKKDRKLFYQRRKDSVPSLDPYKDEKKSSEDKLMKSLGALEGEGERPEKKTARPDDDLWDLEGGSGKMQNLGLEGDSDTQRLERKREERKRLLEANREKRALYGAGGGGTEKTSNATGISFRAAVYQDQFVLPGDEVELILTEEAVHNGKILPRNTIVFALASINKNRVLLQATNINHVPMELHAKDLVDGMTGIRSQRAGELWTQSSAEMQNDAYRDLAGEATQESGRLARGVIRTLGDFFRKKKLGKKDKILLVNDHQIILTNEQ